MTQLAELTERGLKRVPSRFTYDRFLEQEGIPIFEAMAGTEDVTTLPRSFWPRLGGPATFIEMLGPRQAERGLLVGEIPGGKESETQHHLYEQLILIMEGRGLTEIWQEGGPKRTFEWGKGSLFAPPKNTYYRLINGSRDPVVFFSITTAPRVMNALNEIDFVFNCKDVVADYFSGQSDYFAASGDRRTEGRYNSVIWYTNFIPDVNNATVDALEQKVAGGSLTGYRMAGGFPSGHISQWPVGRYHKAHFHGPGAILIGLLGGGYVNLWPKEYGIRPWQDGFADQTVHIEWGPNSIYSPPDGWYHQHMSTEAEPARHAACYGGSIPMATQLDYDEGGGVYKPVSEGGPLINYEDEDPEVRRYFKEQVEKNGVPFTMPDVVYNEHPVILRPDVGALVRK